MAALSHCVPTPYRLSAATGLIHRYPFTLFLTLSNKLTASYLGRWVDQEGEDKRGKRSDLQRVAESIEGGASYASLARSELATFIRYNKGIAEALRVRTGASSEYARREVFILVGPTGCGKTRCAKRLLVSPCLQLRNKLTALRSFAYSLAQSRKTSVCRPIVVKDKIWFDSYEPDRDDIVLLDDFRGEVSLATVLQYADGYELYVERKGASVILKAKTIIITSNDEPGHWWPAKDLAPLWRRVHEGNGAYALWVDTPRILGPSGRLLQEGGVSVTYPQNGNKLPHVPDPPVQVHLLFRSDVIYLSIININLTVSVSKWWG